LPLPSTNFDQMVEHLRALGIQRGDPLVVHSRLLAFGIIEGGAATIYNAFREVLGPDGTIVVPTYTLARGTIYDRKTSPSQGVGILPEFVRRLPGAVRSSCPMHNHAGVGPRADVLCRSDPRDSLGAHSDFAALLRADFRLVLLGTGLAESATFIHHIEALAQVPYRRWLDLPRECVSDDGRVETLICRYYARSGDGARFGENFDVLEPKLIETDAMIRVPTHFGASRLLDLGSLLKAGLQALTDDPHSLVKIK
jgi:aminoglycoside 3-N-acetyltransferase